MLSESQLGFSGMIGTAGAGATGAARTTLPPTTRWVMRSATPPASATSRPTPCSRLHNSTAQGERGRPQRSTRTVVIQSTQAEQNVLQTRRVANHNHCHALTIEYYEVLRGTT